MVEEFQQVKQYLTQLLKKYTALQFQLKEIKLTSGKKQERILLSIIEELDAVDQKMGEAIKKCGDDPDKIRLLESGYEKLRIPLLNCLKKNEVELMDQYLFNLPGYAILPEGQKDHSRVLRNGYLWQGKVLRRAILE